MNMYILDTRYDNAKTFYGKAHIITHNNGDIELQSYSTIVARIQRREGHATTLEVYGYYSQTTARHINEFAQQHGFKKMTKKEMENDILKLKGGN